MKTKEMFKLIKKEAEKLPPDTYDVEFKYEPFKHFDEKGNPLVKQLTSHNINHGRRLCTIWKTTKSIEELQKYFRKYNFEFEIR